MFALNLKKKTGISIDEHGNKKEDGNDNSEEGGSGGGGIRLITNSGGGDNSNIDHTLLNRNKTSGANANPNLVKKEYKPINSYKPTGNLVYSNDFLKKIDDRMNN